MTSLQKYLCCSIAIFKRTKKNFKNNQRDHLVVYSRFQRPSHLTLDNKSDLLDYGISYKICFTKMNV